MEDANRYLKEVFGRLTTGASRGPPRRPARLRGLRRHPRRHPRRPANRRQVGNDNTVRYDNLILQIPADRQRHHYAKAEVRVHEYPDGQLAVFHGPRCLARYKADAP